MVLRLYYLQNLLYGVLNLKNSIFQPIRRHKSVPPGIMELTKNQQYHGGFMPCLMYHKTILKRTFYKNLTKWDNNENKVN